MDRFIDLLRHGEPEGGPRFRGGLDQGLTPAGAAAMQAAVAAANASWDLILTSPARRCAGFAEGVAAGRRVPFEVWPDLRERDWGAWEGRAGEELAPSDLKRLWSDPAHFTPPGAEPMPTFADRVRAAWERATRHDARHLLLVVHGGVVRVILLAVLDLPTASLPLIEVPYACQTRLRIPGGAGRPSLVAHGRWPPRDW
jgi:alpha-ribazole phosphatase